MDQAPRKQLSKDSSNFTAQFKTMSLGTQSPQYGYVSNPQQQMYMSLQMMIQSLLSDPSIKKFYKNEVMNVPMVKLEDYEDYHKIKAMFKSCSSMNSEEFDPESIADAEFYILRSTCDDDLHKALKYGCWTSTNRTNHLLNDRYRECRKRNIPIYLIFTVVNSGQFAGVAQMTGEVRFNMIFNYWWEELKWSGNFPIKWIYVKDLHHDIVSHLSVDDTSIVRLKDGSPLPVNVGVEVLKNFRSTDFVSDIFEAFKFMDGREEKLRYKRDRVYMYIQELKSKGILPASPAKSSKYHGKKGVKTKKNKEQHEEEYENEVEYIKKNH